MALQGRPPSAPTTRLRNHDRFTTAQAINLLMCRHLRPPSATSSKGGQSVDSEEGTGWIKRLQAFRHLLTGLDGSLR